MNIMINKVNLFKTRRIASHLWGLCLILCCMANPVYSLTFPVPKTGDLIGEVQTATVRNGESLGDIGRRYDVGVYEMIEANPNLDPWVPPVGAVVIIPTQFILPKANRVGIVLNLAEMRLYYFHPDKKWVSTFPIGIGKKGWTTPLGKTVITGKKKDPTWYPPDSIRKEHIAKGDPLPSHVPKGPDNPLGNYALYLSSKGLNTQGAFLMHGTNRPAGIGVRTTHGCIRLFPEDIEKLFYMVPTGTPVLIIHEPYKVGWHNGHLYLEAHQPLTEPQFQGSNSIARLSRIIEDALIHHHLVNWTLARMVAKSLNGYPARID